MLAEISWTTLSVSTRIAIGTRLLSFRRRRARSFTRRRSTPIGAATSARSRSLVRGRWELAAGRSRAAAATAPVSLASSSRAALGEAKPACPRRGGAREALRALVTTREGAVATRRAGLNQLRALIVVAPESLRAELRTLTRAKLLTRCARLRPERQPNPSCAERRLPGALARRVQAATAEERELTREIVHLVEELAPQLLAPAGPVRSRPRSCSSPGRTQAASPTSPPSPATPAPPPSPPPQDTPNGTGSTAAATEHSTVPYTRSSSHAANTTPTRSPTSTGAPARAKPSAKPSAASSATSHGTSTDYSRRVQLPLDSHRSITILHCFRLGGRSSLAYG
jgi:hypothetical protein